MGSLIVALVVLTVTLSETLGSLIFECVAVHVLLSSDQLYVVGSQRL